MRQKKHRRLRNHIVGTAQRPRLCVSVSYTHLIEYDPNRTANIDLICYADGEKAYILAPEGLKVGMKVMSCLLYTSRCV